MDDLIPVRFRDCSCPGTPHPDGDVAYLRPYLDYAGGAEALAAIRASGGDADKFDQLLGPVFIKHGVVDWNVVDENGDMVPLDPAVSELRFEDAYELANRADDLYGGQVLAPLVKRMQMSSNGGPTGRSTRVTRRSSPKRPTPSEPSSSPS